MMPKLSLIETFLFSWLIFSIPFRFGYFLLLRLLPLLVNNSYPEALLQFLYLNLVISVSYFLIMLVLMWKLWFKSSDYKKWLIIYAGFGLIGEGLKLLFPLLKDVDHAPGFEYTFLNLLFYFVILISTIFGKNGVSQELPPPAKRKSNKANVLKILVVFLLIPLLLISGLGVSWTNPSTLDSVFSLVNIFMAIACGVAGNFLLRNKDDIVPKKINYFIIFAIAYFSFFNVIYTNTFTDWFNAQVVKTGSSALCWQDKIGCPNAIARKKLDTRLCYRNGLDTAECLADIAIAKNDYSNCFQSGVSEMYQQRCLNLYAAKNQDLTACEMITSLQSEALSQLKQYCREQALAFFTNNPDACPDDKSSGGDRWDQCIKDIAVQTRNPELCQKIAKLSDLKQEKIKTEYTAALDNDMITQCKRMIIQQLK